MLTTKCSYWMQSECYENKGLRGCISWKLHKPSFLIRDSVAGILGIGLVRDPQVLHRYHGRIMTHPRQGITPPVLGKDIYMYECFRF